MSAGARLVLLRHGRTAWNASGRIQGQLDVGLDDVGVAQAARTAPVVAALAPVVLHCSDLRRTRMTVEPLAAATGLPVTYDERLRELTFGAYEGLERSDLADRDPASYAALRRGDYERVRHAEPTDEVTARMLAVLTALLGGLGDDQTAVAVSHGAAIRIAVGALLGWPEGVFRTLGGLDNCGWVELRRHPETGVLRLEAYNRTAS
ncbi:histidine phosphatase family protein [Nocardioides litoris]|uniref:histidine phosphatase family protein n=1 Tax=Nocardioides litoris TaxID=1926648 RepID=UPI001476E2A6|nr:histidine phosphatase family protein [Nocardioides litoris]